MPDTRHGADVAGLVEPEGSGDFEATDSFFSYSHGYVKRWFLERIENKYNSLFFAV